MKENKFDDLIKNRLENYESSVPENMWERIAGNEKEQKGGFVIRRYSLITALLLIGFASLYYFVYTYNKPGKGVAINKSFINKRIRKTEINKLNKGQSTSANALNVIKQGRSGNSNNAIKRNGQIKSYSFLKRKKEKNQASYIQSGIIKSSNQPIDDIAFNNFNEISGDKIRGTDSLANKLSIVNKVTKPDSADNSVDKEEEINKDRFSIELYTSPDLSINGISAANKSYEQILKNAGAGQFSYTFGARMNYEITKRLSAKIGIQYGRVNEKISFFDSVASNNFTSSNRYKNISVPLIMSYKTNWLRNLDLSINTGIILNIASTFKGAIPSVSGLQIDLERDKVYNQNPSTILYLSFDISIRINRRSDFFAEPWFNYRLKNMVNPSYLFNQKIHTSGLSLGLRYHLFKNNIE